MLEETSVNDENLRTWMRLRVWIDTRIVENVNTTFKFDTTEQTETGLGRT